MIETERLVLRPWRDADVEPFATMCSDPEVMTHLGGPQPRIEVEAMIARQQAVQAAQGHCFWAIERRDDAVLLGFCGLRIGGHAGTPVPDELEIGWRLARHAWGQGYAREAALASVDWAWSHTDRDRVTAWTVPANTASWGLMRRIGMAHAPTLDFDHPGFPVGHPLGRHIVYAIDRPVHD
ncbi:GNAT family N-acetyltransferase [Sphingomonas ginsenosidivorax]|uniref:GNAT family N-acetyltransferase n=1 Tax=Sphingomonas ginsenosidivorax TaxID=862135 RepID=A0A5C6UCR1_9SPHN|nr:GNAT family N-acetyltransferase [Sphingomonas ginsenosidivorax]TXC70489.1 GNAT family N-acetyltransferase [Sphingomonas ginsenosidivorax]